MALAVATLPFWLAAALNAIQDDYRIERLELSLPGLDSLKLDALYVTAGSPDNPLRSIYAQDVELHYQPGALLQGQISAVDIHSVALVLDLNRGGSDQTDVPLDLSAPRRILDQLPLQRWSIQQLAIDITANESRQLALHGHMYSADRMISGALQGSDGTQDWTASLEVVPGQHHLLTLYQTGNADAPALELREQQHIDGQRLSSNGTLHGDLGQIRRLPLPPLPVTPAEGRFQITWTAQAPVQADAVDTLAAGITAQGSLSSDTPLRFHTTDTADALSLTLAPGLTWALSDGLLAVAAVPGTALSTSVADQVSGRLQLDHCPFNVRLQQAELRSQQCRARLSVKTPAGLSEQELHLSALHADPAQGQISAELRSLGDARITTDAFGEARLHWDAKLKLEGNSRQLRVRTARPVTGTIQRGSNGPTLPFSISARAIKILPRDQTLHAEGLSIGTGPGLEALLPPGTLPFPTRFGAVQLGFKQFALQQNQVHGTGTFQVQSINAQQDQYRFGPVQLSGRLTLAAGALHADWQMAEQHRDEILLSGATELALQTGHGATAFRLETVRLSEFSTRLQPLIRPWPEGLVLEDGAIALRGDISTDPTGFRGKVESSISSGSIGLDQISLNGVELHSQAALDQNNLATTSVDLHIAAADVGFPVHNIELRAELLADQQVRVHAFSADLLGGQIFAVPQLVGWQPDSPPLIVRAQGLRLAELLALQGQAQLSGTGHIDGELPLYLRKNGVVVADGALWAREPGGTLNYGAYASVQAMAANNQGLKLALDALRNFHYAVLRAGANYQRDGQLTLNLQIEGSSPEVQNGQPVHLNLNVEQNLLKLLESLRYADEIGERVQKQMEPRP